MTTPTSACLCFALAIACANADAGGETQTARAGLAVQPSAVKDPTAGLRPDEDDQALRRGYASNDMKVHSCVKLQADGSMVGQDCPSGIVVFGPYVTAPPSSNLRVQFEIESPAQISVRSDVLSGNAKQFHAALEEQVVQAGTRESFRYRIHLFDAARALEARIGIRSADPVNFVISNFQMNVQ